MHFLDVIVQVAPAGVCVAAHNTSECMVPSVHL